MVYNAYKLVMDSRYNPLVNIQDVTIRHLVMQILAWMWCIIFSLWLGNIYIFGTSAVLHAILLSGLVITVSAFETAKKNPNFFNKWYQKPGFGRAYGGEHE